MKKCCLCILLLLLFCGCASTVTETNFFAMDTIMNVKVWGDGGQRACQAVQDRITDLDQTLSVTRADSAVAQLNANGHGELPQEAVDLLEETLALTERTNGALDPTVYPIVKLWGFTTDAYQVPSASEIAQVLQTVGAGNITIDGREVTLANGAQIDFGAVAKGYAAQRSVELLQEQGVEAAVLSLSGNIQTYGTKPDGSDWEIAIRNPFDTDGVIATLFVSGTKAIVTSGSYERYFEEDGVRYHHIMDPKTGRPADSGLVSVTIVADNALLADGLSTALFVMGTERALDFWRESSDFETILIAEDGTVYVTEGLAEQVECEVFQVVSR